MAFPIKNLDELLQGYNIVFRHQMPAGLPPERPLYHEIETAEGRKPPHLLSPSELQAMKDYIR